MLHLGSGRPNCDFLLAILMSHCIASSNPPATQKPSIAAIIGFQTPKSGMYWDPRLLSEKADKPSSCLSLTSLKSAPAEKDLPPDPVTIATKTYG